MKCLVIDTNVWLDHYVGTRPNSAVATAALSAALERDVALLYTAAQAKDLFYLHSATLKAEEREAKGRVSDEAARVIIAVSWAVLENLDECATAVAADATDVWLARKYRSVHADFEDNLVVAAAVRVMTDYLVTNDERLLKHAPVATITPADLLALLEAFDEK